MKIAPLLVTCAVLSAVTGAVAARLAVPQQASAGESSTDLERRLDELEAGRQTLLAEVQALRDRSTSALSVPAPDRQAVGMNDLDLDELANLLREKLGSEGGTEVNAETLAAAGPDFDLQSVAEELLDESLSGSEKEAIWNELRESGNIEAIVDWFKQYAEANPNDPNAQTELGMAYLQQLFGSKDMMSQSRLATAADSAFDNALGLDDQHWNARFQKAVSYSFWPPALGKQSAAIQQFETLISQQKNQPISPQFAQSYLFLGNMHQQMGNMDQALAAWNEGLQNHPDDPELQAQIDSASGN